MASVPPMMIKFDVLATKMGPKDAVVTVGLLVYLKAKADKVRISLYLHLAILTTVFLSRSKQSTHSFAPPCLSLKQSLRPRTGQPSGSLGPTPSSSLILSLTTTVAMLTLAAKSQKLCSQTRMRCWRVLLRSKRLLFWLRISIRIL